MTTSATPITSLQRYDFAGGANGIDTEFGLPSCTSVDMLHSSDLKKFARKVRKEYCLKRYGSEDGGEVVLPLSESDRATARQLWSARRDLQELFLYANRKGRKNWGMGELLGWAMLQLQARLPIIHTTSGLVRLPLGALTHVQRGDWLLTMLEYYFHLERRSRS